MRKPGWLLRFSIWYIRRMGLSMPIVMLLPALDQQYSHTCLTRPSVRDVCLGCRAQFPEYPFGLLRGHPLASYTVRELLEIIPTLIRYPEEQISA